MIFLNKIQLAFLNNLLYSLYAMRQEGKKKYEYILVIRSDWKSEYFELMLRLYLFAPSD